MTDTDPGQYSDAIRTATDLARNVGRLARERDDAKAAIARVTALLDRTDGQAYVCRHYACQLPTTDPTTLVAQLTP